jgi:hypothetical protein
MEEQPPTQAELEEQIEERLAALATLTHPEDVLAYVERIAERMRYEIWHT